MRSLLYSLLLVSLLLVAASCSTARGQYLEAYGTVAVDHLSSVELLPYSSNAFATYTPVGGTVGGTFNFLNLHVLNVGIDAH